MASKPRLTVKKYLDAKWLIKLTNETTADTIADQSYEAFRDRIYRKYIPLYEVANVIDDPRARARRHKALRGEMQKDIDNFFDQYERVTLNSLSNATLAAKRIQYQFIERRPKTGVKRIKVKALQQQEAVREQQLGKGTSTADPRKVPYRHKGGRSHVIEKLGAGLHREAKKIGISTTKSQFTSFTGKWVTTVSRTLAQGTIADADKQAIAESFSKYRYVAIIDERTTARCESLDGQEFPADEADSVRPPQHFNCRSELQPVTADKAVDAALARDAQRKFNSWLKDQSPRTKLLIVGKGNIKAYREGRYQPPPRWQQQEKWAVDKDTGLPVVPTKENRDRIEVRTRLVDVEFDPSIYSAGLDA